jgi:choline dehydrogenase
VDHPAVGIDCGYRGPVRGRPVLHYMATFQSSGRSSSAAPDLMLWTADPAEPQGSPPLFEIEVVLLRPQSRGSVRLRSADARDAPRVTLPDLDDPSDIQRLAEGLQRGLEVAHQPELRRLCSEPPRLEADVDGLLELVTANAYSLPHVVGTCAMGPRPDDGAVVDALGNVYGTDRLSVIDASIMPDVPSGFTHIPTVMIAERLAEKIGSEP